MEGHRRGSTIWVDRGSKRRRPVMPAVPAPAKLLLESSVRTAVVRDTLRYSALCVVSTTLVGIIWTINTI